MKSNRWWITNLPFRRLGKYVDDIFQDGTAYSIHTWDSILQELKDLKPGDLILNPYTRFAPTVIEKIEYTWAPIQRKANSRIVGWYINGFTILTADSYLIYDSPSFLLSILVEENEIL